jgi:hypothetical protein
MAALTDRGFSLFGGGPFHALIRRFHLLRPSGALRISWIVVIAWIPIMLGSVLRIALGYPVNPIALDISVHARFLVALPLLLMSTQLLEAQTRGVVLVLYGGELADPGTLDEILGRAAKLRSNGWVELVLALGALTIGQLGLWGVLGPTGIVHGIERHIEWTLGRIWYGTIAFPLFTFLWLRWMWRWVIWIYVLVRLSRVPLAAIATHPDHAAGLSCLAWPVAGYCWFIAAFSSVLSGAWATQLIEHRTTVPSLGPTALVLIVGAIIVGYGPLLVFTPQLYAVKRRDLAKNTLLGFDYMRRFDAKWLAPPRDEQLLGSPDIQSLNDMGSAFQVVLTTRLTVFDLMRMKNIVIAVVLPLLPLVATVVSLESVIKHVASAVLPGL